MSKVRFVAGVLAVLLLAILANEKGQTNAQGSFDSFEQQAINHINDYRALHGCGPLTHAPEYQEGVEMWAGQNTYPGHHRQPTPPGEIIAFRTDIAPTDEGAAEALDFWKGSISHNKVLVGKDQGGGCYKFSRIAIAHKLRSFNGWTPNPGWLWVAELVGGGTPPEPPRPRLVSSIAVSPTPVTEGQRVYFTFRIDNAGGSGQTLYIDHIVLKVRKPDGSIWDGPQWPLPNITLVKGHVYEFRLDGIVPHGWPGTWTVAGIDVKDREHGWMPVEQNGITYPYFTVLQADVTPKVLIGKTGPVVTHHWTWVPFSHQIEPGNWTPSGIHLIAEICSQVDGEGEHLKIKDVSTTGFYARIEEDLAFNGTHNGEYICYLAISARPTVNFRNHGSAEIIQWNRDHKNRTYYTQVPTVRRPVLASMVTANHDENAHLDIDGNVTFMEVRIEEDLALDGSHGTERIDWVVLEGTLPPHVQVGFKEGITHEWRRIRFPQPFATEPVVIAQVTTNYNLDPAVTDIRNVDRYGFDIRIEETAPCGSCVHAAGERIDWMAAPAGPYEW